MTEHWAIVPVKGLTESKTRLYGYLGDNRKLLVEALLQDVLSSIMRSRVYGTVMVVSPDESVAVQTRAYGASFLRQTGIGLNRALDQTNRLALREDARSVTVVLADIPLAEPEDFREFSGIGGNDRKVVMAPSLKGGTNMMTISPPDLIRPVYGRWSYTKHLRQAQTIGVKAYSMANNRISFDIDTVSDLDELTRRDPYSKTRSCTLMREIKGLLGPARPVSMPQQPIIG